MRDVLLCVSTAAILLYDPNQVGPEVRLSCLKSKTPLSAQ